jgi:hypothetical protein
MSRQVDSAADLVVEDRFAIVPEWLLDAEIGDAAVRLYAVLADIGGGDSPSRPPSASLAARPPSPQRVGPLSAHDQPTRGHYSFT